MGEETWFGRYIHRRRAATYADALAAWELKCERLDEVLARSAPDSAPLKSRTGTRLRPGEFLQCELTDIRLVETRQRPVRTTSRQANIGINTPVSVGFGTTRTTSAPESDESIVLDTGTVAITDQRVTFAGPKHAREWPLAHLIRPLCDEDGCTTYLPLSTRNLTSGFRYPRHLAPLVNTQLEIALARHSGDWRTVDAWRARRATLEKQRPRRPAGLVVNSGVLERARHGAREEESATVAGSDPGGSTHLGTRLSARAVDWVLASVLLSFMRLFFGNTGSGTVLALVGVLLLYEVFPVWRRGGSIGKRAVGLTVIDLDTGGNPPLWQSFLRSVAWLAFLLTVVAPILQVLRLAMGIDNRAWHDRLAGTTVTRG
jgi:uncharacterized RDD family membrane protein YckC